MTKIILDINTNIHENANKYFSKAKKIKSKLPGVDKIIEKTNLEIKEFEKNKNEYIKKKEIKQSIDQSKKKQWFEKFRYSYTSGGYLFVFGKDAGTNEVLLKKHTTQNDIIFHTEAPGSPFGIVKNALKIEKDQKNLLLSKKEINEVAQIISCFSSQWKKGFGTADAFWVYPNQVSKKANTGEYIAKGSFMVRGEKNIIKNNILQIALGVEKKEIPNDENKDIEKIYYYELFSGAEETVKLKCGQRYVKLEPGQDKYKVIGKEIKKRLKTDIDDLPTWIPNGAKVLKK